MCVGRLLAVRGGLGGFWSLTLILDNAGNLKARGEMH
jgi:hypothetical protein